MFWSLKGGQMITCNIPANGLRLPRSSGVRETKIRTSLSVLPPSLPMPYRTQGTQLRARNWQTADDAENLCQPLPTESVKDWRTLEPKYAYRCTNEFVVLGGGKGDGNVEAALNRRLLWTAMSM